jgi:hypothetical protein
MLTPLQFKSNYFSLLADYENITGLKADSTKYIEYDTTTKKDSLTTEQWENLVEVASIIESNANRLCMTDWHTEKECGTAHCIAGWAQSLAMNDTNYSGISTLAIAVDMLSYHVKPFFWITSVELGVYESLGIAEQLVMKWFIKPILEEARRESYELSNKISQFIQKAKGETQVKELITS